MSKIETYLDLSDAPELLRRFPRLLWIYHKINFVLVPRNWYVRRMLRGLRQSGFMVENVIDAGCGLGDHSFFASRIFRSASVTGVDVSKSNIDLCSLYAAAIKSGRHTFLRGDLAEGLELRRASLVLCISVLQYIPDDMAALQRFRSLLTENGKMILYVPVHFKRYLSWYRKVSVLPHFNYDTRHGRAHTYTSAEVIEKAESAGFSLERIEHTYGHLGGIAYELYSIALYYLTHGSLIQKLASAIGFIVYLPVFLVLMGIDASQKHNSGNGAILLLKKTQAA